MDLEKMKARRNIERQAAWMSMLAMLAMACAQVGSPTGGPKDETPPALIKATPPLGATGVVPNQLILEFDEYVKAGQWRSQLLVSPPIEGAMDLIVRGREVELSWEASLRDSTTYVFQFGKGIADVNEGNPAVQLVHAFSTGPELDTLSLKGEVRDAVDGTLEKNMRVLVYPDDLSLDSIMKGALPQFVGATNDAGAFEVGYLPPGAFRVLVVGDDNSNYVWDAGERAALLPEWAMAGDSNSVQLRAGGTPAPRAPYLSEALRDSIGFVQWRLSEAVQEGDSLSWTDSCEVVLFPPKKDKVSALGWSDALDSAALQLVWHHRSPWPKGKWTTDTLDVPKPRLVARQDVSLVAKPMGVQRPGEMPELMWSVPLAGVDTGLCRLMVDSVQVAPAFEATWPAMTLALDAKEAQRAGVTVALTLLPGALVRAGDEVETAPKDTLDLMWSVRKREALAEWVLRIEGVQCSGLLELTNGKGDRLDLMEVDGDTLFRRGGLLPGVVKAIWWGDLDSNRVWSNVDVATWQVPEPVARMEPVELLANWVVETTWVLDSTACRP